MSKCGNYQCPQYGQHHQGVGQSPNHAADLDWYDPMAMILTFALGFVIIAPIIMLIVVLLT